MSGIAGIVRFDGAPVESGLVQKMTSAMAHRGPDGIQHWVGGSVALGQCMLRTTPESLEEIQPLANEDESLVLVMDGRVDNWEELRNELLSNGAVLRSRSDAELVLRSYETWGADCVHHIDGDFALAVWDGRRRMAFCARDRLGNKPFNYHWDGRTLAFSSETHAVLTLPWVRQEFNEGLLAEFLAFEWFTRDETFWKGVMRLPAAHCMESQAAGLHQAEYWRPDVHASLQYRKDDEYIERYRELLHDAVRRTSRSHRPVAFEVSGGLDSSALFAVAETLRHGGRLPAPGTAAYTLDFGGQRPADELEYARAVGRHLNAAVREVAPARMPLEWYRERARTYRDFPGYPNGAMSLNLRNAAREDGSRVVVTGAGGDEWLGMGGPGHYYAEELQARKWLEVCESFRSDCRTLGVRSAAWWALRSGPAPLLPEQIKRMLRYFRQRPYLPEEWLSPALRLEFDERRRRHQALKNRTCERRGQCRQLAALADAYGSFAREWEEHFSASLGLELRAPFWSRSIVQFAFSTPERLRSRGRSTKYCHRQALHGTLPRLVLDRTTKADFMVTFTWQLADLGAELRSIVSRRRPGWVRPVQALSLVDRRLAPPAGSAAEWQLWTLVGCDALV